MQALSTWVSFGAALVAVMLAGHLLLSRPRGGGLGLLLLCLLAVQAGSLGLQLLRPGMFPPAWRAISGAALPGLLFLLFERADTRWRPLDALHLVPPAIIAALVAWPASGSWLDAALLLLMLGYALALLSRDRRDLGQSRRRQARLLAAASLLALVLVDGLIGWSLAHGDRLTESPWLPFAALALLAPGMLLFVWAWRDPEWLGRLRETLSAVPDGATEPLAEASISDPATSADAIALCQQLEQLLRAERAHAEFGISLAKLARRLRVSARQLSVAVNQVYGRGMRTLLNDWKVADAAAQLRDPELRDKPITEVMFDAGFQTKSNFNKEFALRHAMSPSAYRASFDP